MTLESKQIETEIMLIEKRKAGLRRDLTQIGDTITFDFKRNLKSFILMLIVFLGIFIVFLIVNELQYLQDVPLPEEPINYINSYMSMFGFMVILSAAGFAGSIIAEDFHRQTGNLIFPKISKTRLLIGRVISRYGLNTICVGFYYVLIGVMTFIKYEEIPIVIWGSLGWALLYTFMIFSFVTLMSSIMKSTAISIIVSILFLLIVFNMLSMILRFAGVEGEPLYILTYYEGIITASMNMPDPRYSEIRMPTGMGGNGDGEFATFINWTTPTEAVALIGMLIFTSIFLALTYFLYRRRQSKNE
ncbi:MAG: ABC transporter permease [Candidatus Lokiarchaeota archaeon]|nr:ABC transporter permease [Candidatus Lokiarchaeota archaeon]